MQIRKAIPAILAFASLSALAADVSVKGYMRQDGTYVAPSHRSAPDNNPNNNYSSQGRFNPYTGQQGAEPYRAPTYTPQPTFQTPTYPQQQQPRRDNVFGR